MVKALGMAVMAMLILAQTCTLTDCRENGDQPCEVSAAGLTGVSGLLQPGQFSQIVADCNTCGLTDIRAAWTIPADQPGTYTGTLTLTLLPACKDDDIGFPPSPLETSVKPDQKAAEITGQDGRNRCGPDAEVTWTSKLVNNSNVAVVLKDHVFACPRKSGDSGAGGTAVAPSPISKPSR